MSENNLDKFELEKLFAAWKLQYGEQKIGPGGTEYCAVPVNPASRRVMLEILCRILIEQHGYISSDFGSILCDRIIEASVAGDSEKVTQKNLKSWRRSVKTDLLQVLGKIFPPKQLENADKTYEGTKLGKPEAGPKFEDTRSAKDGDSLYVERPLIDLTQIKGLVKSERVKIKNDPLAFLRKGKNE